MDVGRLGNDLLFAVLHWDSKIDSMKCLERKINYYSLIDEEGLDALGDLALYEQRCCTVFSYLGQRLCRRLSRISA